MAPHIAESLRGLSPGIEITPLVTFEVNILLKPNSICNIINEIVVL